MYVWRNNTKAATPIPEPPASNSSSAGRQNYQGRPAGAPAAEGVRAHAEISSVRDAMHSQRILTTEVNNQDVHSCTRLILLKTLGDGHGTRSAMPLHAAIGGQ